MHAVIDSLVVGHFDLEIVIFLNLARSFVFKVMANGRPPGFMWPPFHTGNDIVSCLTLSRSHNYSQITGIIPRGIIQG